MARPLLPACLAAGLVLLGLVPAAHAARSDAAALQVALRAVGVYSGAVDGVTGPRTRRAVRAFQRRKRIPADGLAGPQTRRALGRRGRPALGSRAMRTGHRGWDVAALQFLLSRRGCPPGGIDGGFGAGTGAAVRRCQRTYGLTADGIAGAATIRALGRRPPSGGGGTTSAPSGPVRFLRPLATTITDRFGMRWGRPHHGIDFPAPRGTSVSAGGVGVVRSAGWNSGGYGNLVVVTHRLGFESWYAHLDRVTVRAGQSVSGGTVIGAVGSTGRSTGPHLHFEVRLHGTPVDPVPLLLG